MHKLSNQISFSISQFYSTECRLEIALIYKVLLGVILVAVISISIGHALFKCNQREWKDKDVVQIKSHE